MPSNERAAIRLWRFERVGDRFQDLVLDLDLLRRRRAWNCVSATTIAMKSETQQVVFAFGDEHRRIGNR